MKACDLGAAPVGLKLQIWANLETAEHRIGGTNGPYGISLLTGILLMTKTLDFDVAHNRMFLFLSVVLTEAIRGSKLKK